MLKDRLIYSLTLIAAIVFFFAYRLWYSWFFLVFILMLIPLDALISFPGIFSKSLKISAPPVLDKNADGAVALTVIHNKPFPVRCVYVRLRVIGDDFATKCKVICPAGDDMSGRAVIDTEQTGLTVFEADRIYAVSLIGLFSKRIRKKEKVSVLVLPVSQKPAGNVTLPRDLILKPKPGGGFSEDHEMRPYVPGDPIKSIHWKLSAKFDSLIIREPLMPPQQSRLIHVSPWDSAESRDRILSHLRWVSDYFFDTGLTFYIRFGDRQLISEIASQEDLFDFLRRVLDKTSVLKPDVFPRITRFSWVYKIEN